MKTLYHRLTQRLRLTATMTACCFTSLLLILSTAQAQLNAPELSVPVQTERPVYVGAQPLNPEDFQPPQKPRVIISTDAGGQDPDDIQSFAHYFLYANLFDTVGLISSPPNPNDGHDPVGYLGRIEGVGNPYYSRSAQAIHYTIDAYARDYQNTLQQVADYPRPDQLRAVVKQGASAAGWPSDIPLSEGAQLIIDEARRDDSRPLYVLIWGGATDVAKALYEAPEIKDKLRIYFVATWNAWANQGLVDSRNYLFNTAELHDLWMIESHSSVWGLMQYPNFVQQNQQWLKAHSKGHGALGELYYLAGKKIYQIEQAYDNFSSGGVKMGDTLSVMYLLSPLIGGTGDLENPALPSWGGQFHRPDPDKRPNYWTDSPRSEHRYLTDSAAAWSKGQIRRLDFSRGTHIDGDFIDSPAALKADLAARYHDNAFGVKTVQRWREAFMADFQLRLDIASGVNPALDRLSLPSTE